MADRDMEIVPNITGLAEFEKAMLEGSPRMAKKFMARVHREAAALLVESAEDNAPYQEGYLASEIHYSTTTDKEGMLTRVGPGKEVFWGLIQEVGASEANVPALHWLQRSAELVEKEVLAVYLQAIQNGLDELTKGGK